MQNGQFLIPANSKKGQLIFSIFRLVDLIIILSGALVTFLLFVILQPDKLLPAIITLIPLLVCAFLVLPVANYHNMLCILQNIYNFYFVEQRQIPWKGWCAKDEFKE